MTQPVRPIWMKVSLNSQPPSSRVTSRMPAMIRKIEKTG